eukprot:scaffold136170_cov45-Tisochrysis_lutea.AAC.2
MNAITTRPDPCTLMHQVRAVAGRSLEVKATHAMTTCTSTTAIAVVRPPRYRSCSCRSWLRLSPERRLGPLPLQGSRLRRILSCKRQQPE